MMKLSEKLRQRRHDDITMLGHSNVGMELIKDAEQLEAKADELLEKLVAGEELYISRGIKITQLEAENERLNKAFDWSAVKVAELKAENEALRTFASAERQTLGDGRDYSLAAYALRDLPITKRAELDDLCHAISKESASRGDWDGLKWHWLNALLTGED